MNATSPFVYLKLLPIPKAPTVVGDQSELLNEALFNACGLAESATLFFRGLFPYEAPHFPWGKHKLLPWFGQYETNDDALERAICAVSKRMLEKRSVLERGPKIAECHERELDTNANFVQLLAVESLLAIEGLIASVATRSLASALSWQYAALVNISEASVEAMTILQESSGAASIH